METPDDQTPGAATKVAQRPDIHPLRAARLAVNLGQKELAEKAGCSAATVSQIERGSSMYSVALASRLAEAVDRDVVVLFGAASPCECGCGKLSFGRFYERHREKGMPAHIARQHRALDSYKRRWNLIGADELCSIVGCSPATVTKFAPRLGVHRYPGSWAGQAPLLFSPKRAPKQLERLLTESAEEGRHEISRTLREGWRRGDRDHMRLGEQVPCANRCGKLVYRQRFHRQRYSGRYCSESCRSAAHWRLGKMSRELIGDLWGGRARQRWGGRWGGQAGAAHGVEGALKGREGGRRRLATEEQWEQVWALWGENKKSKRQIAAAVFGSSRFEARVRRILKPDD